MSTTVGGARMPSALLRLATRAGEEGAYDRVSALFSDAERHGIEEEERPAWSRLLREAGDFPAARRVDPQAGIAAADRGEESDREHDEVLDFEPGERQHGIIDDVDRLVPAFLRWFGGRRDVYARQWYDARRERSGYWPVRERLDEAVARDHLRGHITVGQYVLHPDASVGFAVLDLDPTAAALEQWAVDAGAREGRVPPALTDYAARCREAAAALDLPAFVELSGGAGVHVWMFFEPRIAARSARSLCGEILRRAGSAPPAVAVELFPKQDRLTGKGLGNLIKLPLGVHQATLGRSHFLDSAMLPLDAAMALSSLRSVEPGAIDTIVGRRVVDLAANRPLHPTPTPAPALPPDLPPPSGPRALAVALSTMPPGRPVRDAVDRILAGCTILRELTRRALEDRSLTPNAARALLYSVGLVGRANPSIDEMFAQAGVARHELERVRRGLQAPVGCRRLRAEFGAMPRPCACPIAEDGVYPTPALFALRDSPRARAPVAPQAGAELARDPGDASLAEIQMRLQHLEEIVLALRGADRGPS